MVIGTKRDVPISNIVVSNDTSVSRSTLANRDLPISGGRNSGTVNTAVGQGNCFGVEIAGANSRAILTRVIGLISRTADSGTPVTGLTSHIDNIFIPVMVNVTFVTTVV